MAKVTVQFTCAECGTTSGRWLGKCPGCGAFGTLVEELHGSASEASAARPSKPVPIGDVSVEEAERISTGVSELDRVLGGGLVPASLVLVGGEPGVGKSTLLLTALGAISRSGRRALLVTGEESAAQVSLRAARLGGAESVEILAETELDTVCATLEAERPDVCVIDSVQTLHASALGSAPGSVAQVREAAGRLLRVAKEAGIATVLVGHVTKDGAVAGPRVLEHLVDCVLQFEGDRYHEHRILRATKNRFGSTNELGVFEMTAAGLVGVPDPSELFGTTHPGEVGAAVACALEGTRPILLEVQALVAPTDLAMPRRVGTGVDPEAARDDRRRARASRGRPARERGRVRQRRRRRADRGARRRPRGRARDRVGSARRTRCARAAPRSARSGSPAGCARRRRPSGGSRSARSSGSRPCRAGGHAEPRGASRRAVGDAARGARGRARAAPRAAPKPPPSSSRVVAVPLIAYEERAMM